MNSTIAGLEGSSSPFNPMEEFQGEYRCIASDLRNANGGQSTGPLEIDRPWDAYADDQLGVMESGFPWRFAKYVPSSGRIALLLLRRRCPRSLDVGSGSKADVTLLNFDVRFTPESGHPLASQCPLRAKKRQRASQQKRLFDRLVGTVFRLGMSSH